MQGIGASRELCVAAIHRQSVLRQVVAADGQKVDFPKQCRRRERGGRRFDHSAEADAFGFPEFAANLLDQRTDTRNFPYIGDHGNEQPYGPVRFHAQRRAQLRAHQIRSGQTGSHAAHAERRIVLPRQGQVSQRLIAAHIHQPQDQRAAAERPGNALVGFQLLRLRWRRLSFDEQKFGSQ